jgi:hypothetical protein
MKTIKPDTRQVPAPTNNVPPFTTRFPRPGEREPFSGLCRSQLFALVKEGRVKSYSLKTPGTSRGVRLIDCASLRAVIESFGDNQQQGDTQ